MDKFTIHVAPLPRRFPTPMPVASIGYSRRKTDHIRYAFTTLNFSLILSGRGHYHTPDGTWPVVAPCVITQAPGVTYHYGPDTQWEELYFIYPPASLAHACEQRLYRAEQPIWYLNDVAPLRHTLRELRTLHASLGQPGDGDRIDRLCEAALVEAWLRESSPQHDVAEAFVRDLRAMMENDCGQDWDVHALAQEAGLSPMTFRRAWSRLVESPPHRYLIELRMRHAARLLAETRQPVWAVAEAVGYTDPLYFSRAFRKHTGVRATTYRDTHRVPFAHETAVASP